MFKLTICGRLSDNPNLNQSANGTIYTLACVVYNQRDKDTLGNKKELVWYINFSLFGQRAEYLCKYAKKGSRIIIDGTLAQEDYVSKDGQKTSRLVLKDISTLEIIDYANSDMQTSSSNIAGGFAKPKQESQTNEISPQPSEKELPWD